MQKPSVQIMTVWLLVIHWPLPSTRRIFIPGATDVVADDEWG